MGYQVPRGLPCPCGTRLFQNRPVSTMTMAHAPSHVRVSSLSDLLRLAYVLDCRVEDGCLSRGVTLAIVHFGDLSRFSTKLSHYSESGTEDLAGAPREVVFSLGSFLGNPR
jgi:hypothetical protein